MGATPKCHFFPRTLKSWVPKFPKLGFLPLWMRITYFSNLWLKWGLMQSCNLCLDISNDMCHATYKHVIQSDSWFLMVGSQIAILISSLSFSHNLSCKYSNGSCKPILNIYILRNFQWCNELFNLMNFDLSNFRLKIQNSIKTSTPKVKVHLKLCGLIPSHSFTLSGMWMWLVGCILGQHLCMPLFW
jgi:hypothetical protein